ncbi:RNA methyltransferase, TrmA family [Caldalkalibacillus thermarum TA2.A1]|uniref:23S rRNA (Uracil(1939)-C(5))-methyltransferase RlmD n=1 Tax=Caldalkalibacillus thermarum (strain TA2.A1) TaxID=986075 RepID=F5L448_CALTT|nr:23S rRNA (uracil(1939)-C(5))-methyltransferase RlmD [Caldalkalibacillus thermarum]EGL83877.1 RNA methyltransferase, TrmA family [Caldalkalibacillus thermarum TA2.A1]QZT34661.1 23S rRNA (uracil(1939)-C(5))-methyltransferase RlmD [Caldalkalibacillus thermarum TA2.A1]
MSKKIQLPVQKNDEVELKIHDLNHEAMGVGRYEGYTLFVKDALPGEVVKAKVLKTKKNFGYAKVLEILEQSPARMKPPCPIFARCGGCQLQHLAYEEQLKYKEQLVKNDLERIGGLDLNKVNVYPVIGMEKPWRYRNKTQVPIGEEEGGLIGGFYRPRSHDIIDMEACLIQHEQHDQVIQKVKEIGTRLGIPAYNEDKHSGLLRHVVAKYGFATGQLMIVLVTNGEHIPAKNKLVDELVSAFPNLKSIVQNINTKRTNVIFGDESKVLWGEPYIYDKIGDIRFAISARSFFQVNPVQTQVLYEKAMAYADLEGHETVIDAYCGIGTISLFLAQKAKQVLGVEVVPEAVADAKRNARLNGMTNVQFAVGEAEKIIPWWRAQGIKADVIVVDPPRKGCDGSLLKTIIEMKPERVVYISCNPSTLARDIKILEAGGFETREVQPVDMFPHTSHVEVAAKLVVTYSHHLR